jgi:hypothetical protein
MRASRTTAVSRTAPITRLLRFVLLLATFIIAAASAAAAGPRAFVLRGDNSIVAIDVANPTAAGTPIPIAGLNAGDTLVGIDFRPMNGFLYGLAFNSGAGTVQLYAISHRTGQATPIGATGTFVFGDGSTPVQLFGPSFGFDFIPTTDRIRVVTSAGLNFRIDPNTGAFVDGDHGGAAGSVSGLNMDGPISGGTTQAHAAAYTNNQQNATVTTLYTLDSATNSLYIQNPPNAGTQTLGKTVTLNGGPTIDFTSATGFDILPGVNAITSNAVVAGVGYAALMVGGTARLYTIDLSNGSATLVGPIGDGTTAIHGLALQGESAPGGLPAIAHTTGNQLIGFNTASLGTSTTFTVSLVGGESLVGIDWRPQTGQLFGMGFDPANGTGSATLYRIDPQNGFATVIGAPGGIADGTGNPVSLAGASTFGFDFDPAADRIRIVTNNGINARYHPNSSVLSGLDTAISGLPPGSTGVVGAAYTNSYGQVPGGGVTTLYTLDAASDRLFIQNPPDGGTQTLGVDITFNGVALDLSDANGFDIPAGVSVSTPNSAAVGRAFVTEPQAGFSVLWRIDLATGAATNLGATAGAGVISGLTVGDGPPTATATALMSSVNPAIVAQAVTFTATITPASAEGTVAFSSDGVAIVGCEARPIAAGTGTATCTTTFATTGSFSIVASYGGYDPYLASASATLTQTVSQVSTATALMSSANPANVAQAVTFTATVTPADAAGNVAFTGNGSPIAGCDAQPIATGTGTAICTTTFAAQGNVSIVASYSGSVTHSPSASAPLIQTVSQQATTTVLNVQPSPVPFGRPVTISARVFPADAGTGGTVTFVADGNVLSVTPMVMSEALPGDPTTRVVSIEVSTLSLGAHQLTATFSGDAAFMGSSSAPVTLTIEDTQPLTQYFAEGATGAFFQTDLGILNTSRTLAASVDVTLFPEDGPPIVQHIDLQPLARRSVDVNALLPSGQGVSMLVTSTQPVAAMRQMTWGNPVYGSTLESGVSQPSTTWYFAEGATNVFSLFYLIQNPGSTDATVTLTHLIEGGAAPVVQPVTVPAASRRTIFINEVPGLATAALSTIITSTVPVVAERAMYLNTTQPLVAGAASRGARALNTTWSLAEGATGFFHTYLLLGNPNSDTATVTVHYQLPDGTAFDKTYDVPGMSRRTVDVNFEDPRLVSTAVSMSIASSLPIVSERAMWWGEPFIEGSVAIGASPIGTVWAIGEGAEGGPRDESTFVLVSNGAVTPGTVRFTVVYDDGTNETRDYALAGDARLTVRIYDDFVKARNATFSVLVESVTSGMPITVEVARYQSGGVLLGAGGAAQATRIQ